MHSPRRICLSILLKMEKNLAFSNILLNDKLKSYDLSLQDKKFISALFYGVIERKLTLDMIISKYSSKGIETLNREVREILRMGIYQLLYMDSVPDNAAVNESVELAKQLNFKSATGFINALLRSFIRDNKRLPEYKDDIKNNSVKFSCPEWLVEKWFNEYDKNTALSLLESSLGRAPITIRVNTVKFSVSDVENMLSNEGIKSVKSDIIDGCLEVFSSGSLEETQAYKLGMFYVQDISSQICCEALDVSEGNTVLDLCAAPGGKTFTIAQHLKNNGNIISCDLHEKRVKLISDGAKRLGISCIKAFVNNAKVLNDEIPMADRILCDVPCSGLGVIRRKPEIKYKDPDEFDNLPDIQYEILQTASKYLKVGGYLIYSTCTVSRAENDRVVEKFLENNHDFEGVSVSKSRGESFDRCCVTVTPEYCNSDGFFIAKIRRVR